MPFAVTGVGSGSSGAGREVRPEDIAAAFALNSVRGGGEIRQPIHDSIQITPIGPHNGAVEFKMAADVLKISLLGLGKAKVKRRNFYSGIYIPATGHFHCQLDRWEPAMNSTPK